MRPGDEAHAFTRGLALAHLDTALRLCDLAAGILATGPRTCWRPGTSTATNGWAMIRALTDDDYAGWLPLWRGYLRFYRGEVSDEVTRQTFRRLSGGLDGMTGLVAEDPAGGLIGLAHLVFHPSTWAASAYCYLEDLYVVPQARGSGVSRQLLDAVYAEADRRGAVRTYWETQEYNGAARSLYDLVAHRTSFVVYER
jgi:GNAT superfamily N-acetyltransferase